MYTVDFDQTIEDVAPPVTVGTFSTQSDVDASASAVVVGSGSKAIKLHRDGLWMGGFKSERATVRITPDGRLYLRQSGGGYIGMDPNVGFWMGAENPEDATFFVSVDGKVKIRGETQDGAFIEIDGEKARMLGHDGNTYRWIISAKDE